MARPTPPLALLAAALLATASAHAEEPPRVDLTKPDRWQVGDTGTRTAKFDLILGMRQGGPGFSSSNQAHRASQSAKWVERCEEADEAGNATKVRVHLVE